MRISTSLFLFSTAILAIIPAIAALPTFHFTSTPPIPSDVVLSTYTYYIALYPLPSCLGVPSSVIGGTSSHAASSLNTCNAIQYPSSSAAASVRIYAKKNSGLSIEVFRTPQCEVPNGGTEFLEALGGRGEVEGQWECLTGKQGVVEGIYKGWRLKQMREEQRVEAKGWKGHME